MLVRAFQIHHAVFAAIDHAVDIGKAGEMFRRVQDIGMCRAGIKPDIQCVAIFFVVHCIGAKKFIQIIDTEI